MLYNCVIAAMLHCPMHHPFVCCQFARAWSQLAPAHFFIFSDIFFISSKSFSQKTGDTFASIEYSSTFVAQVVLRNPADFQFRGKYDRVIFIETLGDPDTYEVMQCRMALLCTPTSTSCWSVTLHKLVFGARTPAPNHDACQCFAS